MVLLNLIVFILVLGVIILVHEFGHFYFAKKAKILCHEFAIGMGPVLFQKRKGETAYSIRAIPIGGFVSMAGEAVSDALIKKEQVIGLKLNQQGQAIEINLVDSLVSDVVGIVKSYDLYGNDFDPLYIELDVKGEIKQYSVVRDALYRLSAKREMWITPAEKSFESKTLWQRFLVIFAGPFMNFILAFVLFLVVGFFVLKPNLDSSEISVVGSGTPANTSGLLPGDVITSINNQPINSWDDLSRIMKDNPSVHLSLSYIRQGITYNEPLVTVAVVIQSAGITNVSEDGTIYSTETVIGRATGRASAGGGLKSGDLITHLEQGTTKVAVNHWDDIISFFKEHNSGKVTATYINQDNEVKTHTYDLISERALGKLGYQPIVFQIGISPTANFDLGYTLAYPFKSIASNVKQVLNTLGLLFDQKENLGVGDLSGPVGIFSLVSQTTSQGLLSILGFTAFLSINIGLLNLMPIPALDGGRLVFLGIEAITRKPLNRKIENTVNNLMFFLLIGLFIFVTYNDILRLLGW